MSTPGQSPRATQRRFAFFVAAIGVVEVALAVGFAAFAGQAWIALLGLLAIPNFVLAWRTIRATR